MIDLPWNPTRILVVSDAVPGLPDYLASERPGLEVRGRQLGAIDSADIAWAQAFVGFRKPPVEGWGQIRWIHSIGAGVDGLLAAGPIPPSIALTRSPEDFGPAIGEWCVARALAVNQHLSQHERDQAARRWHRELEPHLLRGQRVLVLGTGLVGRGVARAFGALGARVQGLSRSGRPTPDFETVRPAGEFESAIIGTDWLVLAAPNTRETRHWLDRAKLSRCAGAFLLNVGRGLVVDEGALPDALDQGWISGAALDVFEREPLDEASPLWTHPKVMLSPHVSGPSTLAATGDGFLECLDAWSSGQPPRWIVDPDRGY